MPLLQIIKIIPKQIHIQLKKERNKQRKKKLRTAIEWDYGILPSSEILLRHSKTKEWDIEPQALV